MEAMKAWPAVLAITAALGCTAGVVQPEPFHDTISIVSPPRCAGVRSCVLGHVTAAGTAAPVAEAVVFLTRELEPGEDEPLRFYALTDEQGVFVVDDPPAGSYSVWVYKGDSSAEVTGMDLGGDGTTMVPVRLALD